MADDLLLALKKMGLLAEGERALITPLAGGVSSDIVKVQVGKRIFCVKRALARLKVAADWQAPLNRNDYEREWFSLVRGIVAASVPEVIASQPGLYAMAYLDPAHYPLWKNQLRDGAIEPRTAAAVGELIARIHAATAGDADVAARFASDDNFHALRIEPYLLATAVAQPGVGAQLRSLATVTASTRLALVHGDLSPKNILVGDSGPVLLDAECAWYGDPAFDVAFCLTHLLLKCIWRPLWRERYLTCYDAFCGAYRERISWESAHRLDARAAALLPGILLARIHGKSPVEYITAAAEREHITRFAVAHLREPAAGLDSLRERWSNS